MQALNFCQLTSREKEVIKLVARGLSNKEITVQLNLTNKTVAQYLYKIFRKLGVQSRVQAIIQVLKIGWLVIDDLVGEQGS